MAANKSHIPFIRRSAIPAQKTVTVLDSVWFRVGTHSQVLSEVDDMLLPFSNRRQVDLLRRAAYARYRSSKRMNWVTILARRTHCRRIMNPSELEKMVDRGEITETYDPATKKYTYRKNPNYKK